jgi:tetratricopeptide (TPR) repeat protein
MAGYVNAARREPASATHGRRAVLGYDGGMRSLLVPLSLAVALAFTTRADAAPPVAEATSLLGKPLIAEALPADTRARLEAQLAEAQANWQKDVDDADALIWAGRRTAYLGRYREAIAIFSEGIARHPGDARMYRHRGHRYLTVREIDRAVADLEKADALVTGQPDPVEPDGLPNARNIPTGTLNSNVWYHLALAYYLQGDFGRAAGTWRRARDTVANPDNLVACSHWLYLALRRQGRDAEAAKVLEPVTPGLDVIENGDYYALLQMYRGERAPESLLAEAADGAGGAALRYGVGAWQLVNGGREQARALWQSMVDGPDWPAFGNLAAEAELARAAGTHLQSE